MKAYETQLTIPVIPGHQGMLAYFSEYVAAQFSQNTHPIRFVVTETNSHSYNVELGVLETDADSLCAAPESIFNFSKRVIEDTSSFNAVMLVPTGIGAIMGGHAGDAAPASRLLSSICDNLITHPNVVNASDLNEMSENTLYVEGSNICRLMMGQIGLQKVRSNRVLTVIEKHPTDPFFVNGAINTVNASRAATGLNCDRILVIDPAMQLIAETSIAGRAIGRVEKLDHLFDLLEEYRDEYDNISIASIIKIPTTSLHKTYFGASDEMLNPWGGVEAIFTHAVSSVFGVQSAHSPMMENQIISSMDVGVVDARKAAEAISFTYMHCTLKGLQHAPRVVTNPDAMKSAGVLTASNISCLVIPDGCVGLPTLAALEQGIPVIAVTGNKNIMCNDLTSLPWAKGQLHIVENYFEALGVMAAIKSGVAVDTLKRPIALAQGSDAQIEPKQFDSQEINENVLVAFK